MDKISRKDDRAEGELRPLAIETGLQPFAEGSALVKWGRTQVICAVSVSPEVPGWLRGRGRGWITAQYAMLPRATSTRNPRAGYEGQVKGRAQEIQRLIGRSLRAGVDLDLLGEQLLSVDCDVLVADGGTRCASITGAWVAVRLALGRLLAEGRIETDPVTGPGSIWAVSAGLVDGAPLLDLAADEDQRAEADFNLVFRGADSLIEIQGTGERRGYDWSEVETLHRLCQGAGEEIRAAQAEALQGAAS